MNHAKIPNIIAISFCLTSFLFAGEKRTSTQTEPAHAATARLHSPAKSPFLLPEPKHAVFTGKTISGQKINIVTEHFPKEGAYLEKLLQRKGAKVNKPDGLKILLKQKNDLKSEAYTISVKSNQITVTASNSIGIAHGIHTLTQLFRSVEGKLVISEGEITDSPSMKIRGVYLNLRTGIKANQEAMDNLKSLFSTLAELKFNTLILEFADNVKYDTVTFPKTEAHAFSKAQLKELAQYAQDLHLEIIPYFQYLSHCSWLLSNPENIALLENPANKGWNTAWCPSNPKVNKFVDAVLVETIEIFHPKYIHIAMDEISYGPFHHCDLCKQQEPAELFKNAILHVYNLLKSHHVGTILFHDQLLPFPNKHARNDVTQGYKIIDSLPKDILINIWDYSDNRQAMLDQINYFTAKDFKVFGACFYNFKNIRIMGEEYSANPNSLGMIATYWYLVRSWSKFQVSPKTPALTTLTAAYSWNPTKSLANNMDCDPVAEFGSRWIGTPEDLTNLDQKPLAILGNSRIGHLVSNWPGSDLGRSLTPLPTTMISRGIQFNLNQDQTLLTVSGIEGDGFPLKAQDINVNLKAKYLTFVHACGVPFNVQGLNILFGNSKMPLIGNYQIYYTNGKTVNVPLKYRWNITDWNARLSPIAGRNIYTDAPEKNIRFQLCSYLWTNPFPNETIARIKLSSNSYQGANIACLAITALSPLDQPIMLDNFNYTSIEEFKKIWQPTIPKQPDGKDGIKFEKDDDIQDDHVLVLTAPENTTSDRIILDKDLAISKKTLLSHNLIFDVETNTRITMGIYLGDGSTDWKNYRVQYVAIQKGRKHLVIQPTGLSPEHGKIKLDEVKKLRLSFFLGKKVETTIKVHKIQWVKNHIQTDLNRGSWSE